MKKRLLIWFLLLIFLSGSFFHFASYSYSKETQSVASEEDVEASESVQSKRQIKKEELRERIEARIEAQKEKKATKAAERRERFAEKRKIRIQSFWKRMLKRLKAALARQEKLAVRIESRIEKFKEKEADTTEAEAELLDAQEMINVVKNALVAAEAQFELIFTAEDPKEMFSGVKDLVYDTKDSLKAAHQSLVGAIRVLKNLKTDSSE